MILPKNGDLTGNAPNSGVAADIGFSQAVLVPDSSISSIMKNKIETYFSEGSGLTYINSSYNIYCYYNRDTALFKSGIYGLGSFYQVYGEVNGFIATFGLISNINSYTDFHAHDLVLQEYSGFTMWIFKVANIVIDNLATSETNVFVIGEPGYSTDTTGSRTNSPHMLNVSVKNVKFGKGQSGYPDSNDLWYLISLSNCTFIESIQIKIDIGNLYMNTSNIGGLFYIKSGSLVYNTSLVVNIDNLVHRDSHIYNEWDGALIYNYGPGLAINNTITYNIKQASIDATLLGFFNFTNNVANKNNRFNLNCGDVQKNSSGFSGGALNVASILSNTTGSEPLYIKVKGNFRSFDNNPVITAFDDYYSFPSPNRYEFSGRYQTATPGIPVAHFYANTGKIVALTDALLINDGVTNSIFAETNCNGFGCLCCTTTLPINIPVYLKNVHANAPVGSNITPVGGTITVEPDISSFFK